MCDDFRTSGTVRDDAIAIFEARVEGDREKTLTKTRVSQPGTLDDAEVETAKADMNEINLKWEKKCRKQ